MIQQHSYCLFERTTSLLLHWRQSWIGQRMWKKSVMAVPCWQLVIGSIDSLYCVMISLVLWLDFFLENNPTGGLTTYILDFLMMSMCQMVDTRQRTFCRPSLVEIFSHMKNSVAIKGPLAVTVSTICFDTCSIKCPFHGWQRHQGGCMIWWCL
jgi:hypothetical protein